MVCRYDAVQETAALNGEGTVTEAGLRKPLSSRNSAREKEVNGVKQLQHSSLKSPRPSAALQRV